MSLLQSFAGSHLVVQGKDVVFTGAAFQDAQIAGWEKTKESLCQCLCTIHTFTTRVFHEALGVPKHAKGHPFSVRDPSSYFVSFQSPDPVGFGIHVT